MLTEKTTEAPAAAPAPTAAPSAAPDNDSLTCYFEGDFVPMRDAKVSVMTHAFMYGTATFEGIRAYWNEDQGKLYGLKVREHAERLGQSCRILMMEDVPSTDELTELILETVRRNGFREDVYIRPSIYKSTKAIGVRLHHLENQMYIVALVFASSTWAVTEDSIIAFASAGIAFASTAAIFVPMARSHRLTGRRLLVGGGFYLVYLVIVVAALGGVF